MLSIRAAEVVREAVGNAVRHSGASELSVTISVEDELVIEIVDDGIGNAEVAGGTGLSNLRRRTQRCHRIVQRRQR